MSQQNVNTPASESKESSVFKGQGDLSQAGEVLGAGFFAPVESDLVDSLLGRYQHTRAIIGEIAGAVTSHENAPAVAHFNSGNLSGRRGDLPRCCLMRWPSRRVTSAWNRAQAWVGLLS